VIGMLLLGLALVVVGGLGVALLELLLRRADVAAALVFVSVLLDAVFGNRMPALVLPGGVQVYVTDMVASLILGAAVLRLLRTPRFDRYQWNYRGCPGSERGADSSGYAPLG
jgi:hypothetical protein